MKGRFPSLAEYRIIVATILLTMWVVVHLIDIITQRGVTTPFIDAAFGAVITWLFGGSLLKKNGDR